MDFVDVVKHAMSELGISGRRLGTLSDISNQWVSFCLNRKYKFSMIQKRRVADELIMCANSEIAVCEQKIEQFAKRIRELEELKTELMEAGDEG